MRVLPEQSRAPAKKREKRIGFEVSIETALGMANVEAIAQSSRRLEAMSFGVSVYAVGARVWQNRPAAHET